MKILIVGDNPSVTGGVCNYTRPLMEELSVNIETYYLYSASRLKADYRLFSKPGIEKDNNWPNNNVYKIYNSQNLDKNFDNLKLDITSPVNDKLFEDFIDTLKPETIHINENIGFSSEIVNIAKKKGIKVFVTVHEYWWLCPKRVMVDYNRKVCDGPKDMDKCSHCIKKESVNYSSDKRKRSYLIHNQFSWLHKAYSNIKPAKKATNHPENNIQSLGFLNGAIEHPVDLTLKEELTQRLEACINSLNIADKVIAVSSDVKRILTGYGVNPDKILIQHIGSTIAERKIDHKKELDVDIITIGFIGGVSYYKGVHQLVDAFLKLPNDLLLKSKLEIFGVYNPDYVESIKKEIIKEHLYKDKITFHGRYKPADIPNITNQIDISVLPSLCADTAPQTIFESFSAGLPIIAPDIGGFKDFIKDGINGRIYKGSSVLSLTNVLKDLISNPLLIKEFKDNIPAMKTISENTTELLNLYNERSL
jgi:glycosyltransferase involved in cell wall biosynthesis